MSESSLPPEPEPPRTERTELAELRTANTELSTANAELRELNAALVLRVAELESRLGQSPRNSSRPPSSEGYAKPAPRSTRRRSGRDPGGQPGSAGTTLYQVPDPDTVVVHVPARCAGCGAGLTTAPVTSTERRQVFDLPAVALSVAEHRLQHRACGCGTVTMADPPAGVGAPVQYGPGVRALATYLLARQHLPYQRVAECLADVLGAPVSVGTLAAMLTEAADGLAGFCAAARDDLAAAPVAHFDETGMRADGRLAWVHSAGTDTLTLLSAHPRRGVEAMETAGVLPAFAGVAVHDGWAPYRRYDGDQGVLHALCNAHHLRELAAVAEAPGQDWAERLAALLVEVKNTTDTARELGADELAPALLAAYRRRYDALLAAGRAANPQPAGTGRRTRRSPALNLIDRLDRHAADVLRFAADLRVPFDNNLAERDLRMVKLQAKVSGGFRTFEGLARFCVLRSYLSTVRKNGERPLVALRQLFAGHPWMPLTGYG